jgi:hypothetical protein
VAGKVVVSEEIAATPAKAVAEEIAGMAATA